MGKRKKYWIIQALFFLDLNSLLRLTGINPATLVLKGTMPDHIVE